MLNLFHFFISNHFSVCRNKGRFFPVLSVSHTNFIFDDAIKEYHAYNWYDESLAIQNYIRGSMVEMGKVLAKNL